MITLKVKLTVFAGFEREVFASCGAIVRARLQDQVEETVRDAVRIHGGSAPLRITLHLGTLRWATWKSEFPSLALSALRRRTFTVERDRLGGTVPPPAPYSSIAHPSGISSRGPGGDHRNAIEDDVRGGRDSPSAFESDTLAEHAVPRDGIVALADFLEKGHFPGPPPWVGASPTKWFADELAGNQRHIVDVLKSAVGQPMHYARLRNAVGAALAARTRVLCDSTDVPPVSLENAPTNYGDAYPSKADRSIRRMSNNGEDARSDRPSPMSLRYHPSSRPARRASPRAPASDTTRPSAQEVIDVTNAGLICLWPLLPAFLAAIDLLPGPTHAVDSVLGGAAAAADDAAAADEAQIRVSAVVALDYLVWGDPEWREWRMPINKLVCGLPQDVLIDAPVLDEGSREKIDAWLHALPLRVPGFGSCGVSDLRQLFLQRSGKLVSENARWRIEVEADASDVLLDPLPWPLQQAVLPWLTSPIEVIWR